MKRNSTPLLLCFLILYFAGCSTTPETQYSRIPTSVLNKWGPTHIGQGNRSNALRGSDQIEDIHDGQEIPHFVLLHFYWKWQGDTFAWRATIFDGVQSKPVKGFIFNSGIGEYSERFKYRVNLKAIDNDVLIQVALATEDSSQVWTNYYNERRLSFN